jgi:4-amino-4-deoxy-L-arabinose transferase-like glycosyltransferase
MSVGAVYRGGLQLPEPQVHDEFSCLLAADTFAHGRLTNPTHPMWRYLQTFYVLQTPSYQSKYPPGQGLMLAGGMALTGEPIVGVWLATVGLVLAAAWMLSGFVPRGWAIAGAAVLAVHPQIVEWSRIYWGGTLAAAGGVLVLGAWVRLDRAGRAWRWIDAIAMGGGLGILLNTRPYEGLAAAIPILILLAARAVRSAPLAPRSAGGPSPITCPPPQSGGLTEQKLRSPVPAAAGVLIVLSPLLLWTGYYNFRVTGNPLRLPYLVYEQQYAAAPPLLVLSPRPVPAGIPPEMREYAEKVELPNFEAQRSDRGFFSSVSTKLQYLLGAVIDTPPGSAAAPAAGVVIFAGAVLIVYAVRRDHRLRIPVAITLAVTGATLLSNWTRSQYVAPAAGAMLLLFVGGIRELGYRSRLAGRLVIALAFGLFAFHSLAAAGDAGGGSGRARVVQSLAQEPGRQLVIVRYVPGYRADVEWVENGADIDSAQTVWARDPGPGLDGPLLAYFHDRAVWRMSVDRNGARFDSVPPRQ